MAVSGGFEVSLLSRRDERWRLLLLLLLLLLVELLLLLVTFRMLLLFLIHPTCSLRYV